MGRKWTPGPWIVSDEWNVDGPQYEVVAGSSCVKSDDESCANANLIAAAPDLYEALEVTIGYIEWMIEDGCKQCGGDCSSANPPVQYCPLRIMRADLDTARAALTKAEGKRK